MNLYRIDLCLDYLYATNKDTYTVEDVLKWIKNEIHIDELDRGGALTIKRVRSESDITDYLDDYNVYNNVSREDLSLKEVREDLEKQRKKTDIEKVIELLEKSGYVVTKKS